MRFLPVAVGAGYLIGYIAVSGYAGHLGVQPVDLDVRTQDYLLLASVLGGILSVAALLLFVSYVTIRSRDRWDRVVAFVASVFAWGLLVATTVPSALIVQSVAALVLGAATPLVMAWCHRTRASLAATDRRFVRYTLLAICVSLLPFGAHFVGAGRADSIMADPSTDARAPLPFSLVLPSSTGLIEVNDEFECVLRVAPRAVIRTTHRQLVLFEAQPTTFVPSDCA